VFLLPSSNRAYPFTNSPAKVTIPIGSAMALVTIKCSAYQHILLHSALKTTAMWPSATPVPAHQTTAVTILTVMTNPNFVLPKKLNAANGIKKNLSIYSVMFDTRHY
jgi:hypothetical protein